MSDHNLLIVSDLHLSEGRGPETKKFSPNEDFFFDEEFARFLGYYQDPQRWPGAKWHLIVNGDFLDLLQVVSVNGAPPDLKRDRPEYGLACGERETVFKLGRIAEGHWQFFEALAGFVAAGNLLTVIKGNHDVEFHFAGVQEEFLRILQAAYRQRVARDVGFGASRDGENINAGAVRFSDWFYYEKKLLWVEHGNRYDGLNTFKYWLAPLLPEIPGWEAARKDEVDLPFGSLFVRYLFNRIERVEPFADNVKPATKFLWWLARHHPVTALFFAFGDGRYMLRKVRRAWKDVRPEAYALREQQHRARLALLSARSGIERTTLDALDGLRERSILKEPSAGSKILRSILIPSIFLPLLGLAVLGTALSIVLAAAPLLANVLPGSVRELLWDRRAADAGRVLVYLRWAALPLVILGAVLLLRWMFTEEEKHEEGELAMRARRIVDMLDVRNVVMGHTHDADLRSVGEREGRAREYFNTGTWTTVYSEEERLTRKEVEFIFIQGLRRKEGLQLKLVEWDDAAGEPRLVKLIDRDGTVPAGEGGRGPRR